MGELAEMTLEELWHEFPPACFNDGTLIRDEVYRRFREQAEQIATLTAKVKGAREATRRVAADVDAEYNATKNRADRLEARVSELEAALLEIYRIERESVYSFVADASDLTSSGEIARAALRGSRTEQSAEKCKQCYGRGSFVSTTRVSWCMGTPLPAIDTCPGCKGTGVQPAVQPDGKCVCGTPLVICSCGDALDGSRAEQPSGASLITAERKRQVDEELWSSAHDDDHEGCMAAAGAVYALGREIEGAVEWPWLGQPKFGPTRLRELVKAGALIAAEIDCLLRAQSSAQLDEAPEAVMPRVAGKPFRCACGASVFTRVGTTYTCNGCGEKYTSDPDVL